MEKALSFVEFLAADGPDFVDVPVRGGTVRIGSLTGEDFVAWTELRDSGAPDARKNASALLILRSLVDATGKRIGDEAQVERIRKMNLRTSETLLRAIFKLNGISQKGDSKND